MDIDQKGEVLEQARPDGEGGRQIIVPGDALPAVIHVIPQEHRPFFPGQAIPLVMNAEIWLPTFKAIQEADQKLVGLIAMRRMPAELPVPGDLFDMGTVCRIHRIHSEGAQLQVLLEGLQRFRVRNWVRSEPPLVAAVQYFPDHHAEQGHADVKAYAVAIINTIKELIPLNPLFGEELKVFLDRSNPNEPSALADFAASLTTASKEELQEVLETTELLPRLEKVVKLLTNELGVARTQMEIRQHIESQMQTHQREALLREQLKFIQKELGISKDDKTAESEKFEARLEKLTLTEAAADRATEELSKLALLEVGSPEYGVTRNYLDWLTALPWGIYTEDVDDLAAATKVLDRHHEGLKDVKQRIREFLALGIMKSDVAGSIILFVGPPGVGKTSLGRAIAEALGRKFYRFSVGGMRDEAEIKGHRRTYIGAMPGKLLQALKDTQVANPVIMLDELDKIGASFQGDPASALLEVLDPEQNSNFRDHYLDLDFDLSKVLFISTANQLDTIPAPLLDRTEIIHLSGYLAEEKLAIARKHLLPRQLERAGLKRRGDIRFDTAALKRIIDGYSREAGVRRLEKNIGAIVRKAVIKLLDGDPRPIRVRAGDVAEYLGKPIFQQEKHQSGVGVVTGLAWTALGGVTLPVEAIRIHDHQAGIRITGQLGDVMSESANIAYSYARANAKQYGVDEKFFDTANIHLHVPAGATPKDGPSAGVAMATALISLGRGQAPKKNVAMTGELTITGAVYPVGGITEKLLAAKRQKITEVILPSANQRDFDEVPEHVREGLTVHFVESYQDVSKLIFD
ncbi:MAG: endopeptidase La [Gammaproteobacteria bacterium]|nr:endopeptidase La [Gammaproteobacteria bacterium]